jgi:hypothetical protein
MRPAPVFIREKITAPVIRTTITDAEVITLVNSDVVA